MNHKKLSHKNKKKILTQIHVRWLLISCILSEVCVMQEKKNTPAHGNSSLAASPISYLLYYFCKKVFITSQFDVIVTNDFLFNVHLFFIETSSITYFELLSAECRYLEFVYQYSIYYFYRFLRSHSPISNCTKNIFRMIVLFQLQRRNLEFYTKIPIIFPIINTCTSAAQQGVLS